MYDGTEASKVDTEVRIKLRERRAGRATGWVVICSECGELGDPGLEKWTKNQAAHRAGAHAHGSHDGDASISVPS